MEVNTKQWTDKIKKIVYGKNKKYKISTMGCKLNENDSEKIEGMLVESGFEKTENVEEADIIIFNTCCIRENAEDKLFGKLGETKKYKKNKEVIIAIGGCMMQEVEMKEIIRKSYPFVDIVFGTHTMEKFPENLYKVLKERTKIEDILDIDGEIYEGLPIRRSDENKASVLIMNGCNNFCTYCIVPYVRGRERSREPKYIINEIEELAKKGYKEILLLGQNVNSYLVSEKEKNRELNYEIIIDNKKVNINSFATLLKAIDMIKGIEIIRFISPHPKDFTDDVIEVIAESKHIAKLIHLPLQSGSSNILKKMNRKYTKEEFLELVNKIRKKIPEVSFTTDIIVGFPTETEEDFQDTLDIVKQVKFEQIFMFIYSIRKGTPAEKMEGQIEEKVKHERFNRLKELFDDKVSESNKKYVGTICEVLVEGESKTNKNILTGRTKSNKIVNFEGNKSLQGSIINVRIIADHKWYLEGKIE